MPPLAETFSKTDKKPFGTYIAYRQLENMFNKNNINIKNKSFDKTWNTISDTASLYVCITPNLYVNSTEIDAMLQYVHAGNSLFIAANNIDEDLLKSIGATEHYYSLPYFNFYDSIRTTTTYADSNYAYYYHPFKNYFTYTDTIFTKVLGLNENDKPNQILFFYGKGKLFLHCDPKAFSNYFLLKNDNYKYLQSAFAFTDGYPDHVYWDDYYRRLSSKKNKNNNDDKNFSSFSEIMKHPPLAAAFWLSLVLLFLYISFGGKRRQRTIPLLKPTENTTVAFAETIAQLYLEKKDNKNIAEKMCTYFNEHVRNNYFLNANTINDNFITTLSRKAGVPQQQVESLYRAMQHAQQNTIIDDYQLLSLNQQIQNFYKNQ